MKFEWKNAGEPPRPTLIGHVIGTRTTSNLVTDAAMSVPPDWDRKKSTVTVPPPADGFAVGHRDDGPTLVIQSLAVLEEHQHKGVATVLLGDYIQRIQSSHIVQRIALICRKPLLSFYSRFGFENKGLSSCQLGGGEWFDMVSSFQS